jgi:hypothetical protein
VKEVRTNGTSAGCARSSRGPITQHEGILNAHNDTSSVMSIQPIGLDPRLSAEVVNSGSGKVSTSATLSAWTDHR